jgi:hypothetical protein
MRTPNDESSYEKLAPMAGRNRIMSRWMKRRIERSRARCEQTETEKSLKESRPQERFRKDGTDLKVSQLSTERQYAGSRLLRN